MVVVDHLLFRYLWCWSDPELFAKSKVIRNLAEIWTFLRSQNLLGHPSKSCSCVITHASRRVAW